MHDSKMRVYNIDKIPARRFIFRVERTKTASKFHLTDNNTRSGRLSFFAKTFTELKSSV